MGDSITKKAADLWTDLNTLQQDITVHWIGVGGLRVKDFIPLAAMSKHKNPLPDILIIAVGTNDIYYNTQIVLKKKLVCLVSQLRLLLPNTKIMYSDILPRLKWHRNSTIEIDMCCEKRRKFVNHSMSSILGPAKIVKHPQFIFNSSKFIKGRPDWVHLTSLGYREFFHNFITFMHRL